MTFDYIIIGAGSAGCVLANRLSADPARRVLLLEAGGPDKKTEIHIPAAYSKLNRTEVDWGFETEPQPHVLNRKIYLPRGKALGGSSSTNAMAYVRGNRADYDEWATIGNPGWSYEEVLPYFIKSEHNEQIHNAYHGQGGPLNITYATGYRTPVADAFVKACAENGIPENSDYNGAEQAGASLFQFTIKDQKRWSTAAAFLKPALKRPNLKVITFAHTTQILLERDRAVGVEFLTGKNTTEKAFAQKEVILSAGSFNSPQILMLSGIGDKDELQRHGINAKKHLPGVGKNLQDHLFTGVSALATIPTANDYLSVWGQIKGLTQYIFLKKGPMTISPLEANAFLKMHTGPDPVDFQFHFAPVHMGNDGKADFYNIDTFPHTSGYTILPTLLKPKSVGHVGLHSSDPLAAPLIDPRFLSEEDDLLTLLKGTKKALEIMEAKAFGPFRKEIILPLHRSSDEELILHIKTLLETVYHPIGTCKMGHDEMAVVDCKLKVQGIEGLRVADASVMPRIIAGNTNAACIMIGEKAADLVLEEG
ncbi:MAG: GMC family oxidoreductase N-terminal domain-containing protein [Spirosomataceae bacterium]